MAASLILRAVGRVVTGIEVDGGSAYHIVPVAAGPRGRAACGSAPRRMAWGWSWDNGDGVTCRRCLKTVEG
jgi:hypothetical protein